MPITLFYAGLLGLLFLAMSIKVVVTRGATKQGLGDGGDKDMLRAMRGHANFAEYVPMILVIMALLEVQGTAAWQLHALGGALLFARLSHGYTFMVAKFFPPGRMAGATLTLIVLLAASALAAWQGMAAL